MGLPPGTYGSGPYGAGPYGGGGAYVPALQLSITPATALYTQLVDPSLLSVSTSNTEGRTAVIIDFNTSEGLYARDLGAIFSWPTSAKTVIDIWQPSVAPEDGETYYRLSYHCLMTSLKGVGWQHAREMNLAYLSTADLTLLLTFDHWPPITLTVPSSAGQQTKAKVTLPPNKWKMVEVFLSSTQPFRLWTNDLEMKVKSWGSAQGYRLERPVSG